MCTSQGIAVWYKLKKPLAGNFSENPEGSSTVFRTFGLKLEDTTSYGGLLLAPAEGFRQKKIIMLFYQFLPIYSVQ